MAQPSTSTPTISRVLDDHTLVELVYDPVARISALAISPPTDAPSIVSSVDLPGGERLVPYPAENNLIASECVMLPSHIGACDDKATLVEEVVAFIHRYVDLSPTFEAI